MVLLSLLLACRPPVVLPADFDAPGALGTETARVPAVPCAREAAAALRRAGRTVSWDRRIAAAAAWDLEARAGGRWPTLAAAQVAAGAAGSPAVLTARIRAPGGCAGARLDAIVPSDPSATHVRLGAATRGGETTLLAASAAARVVSDAPGGRLVVLPDDRTSPLAHLVLRPDGVERRAVSRAPDGTVVLRRKPDDGWAELLADTPSGEVTVLLLPPTRPSLPPPLPEGLGDALARLAPAAAVTSSTAIGPCGTAVTELDGVAVTADHRCATLTAPPGPFEAGELMWLRPLVREALQAPGRRMFQAESAAGALSVRTLYPFGPDTVAQAEAELVALFEARWPGVRRAPAPAGALANLVVANASDSGADQDRRGDALAEIAAGWSSGRPHQWLITWTQELSTIPDAFDGASPAVFYDVALARGTGPQGEPAWHVAAVVVER